MKTMMVLDNDGAISGETPQSANTAAKSEARVSPE